jgi:predicted lipid-binding transport protein (Tim44 family)
VEDRRDDRSLGQLFGDLTRQMTTLVRQEIELARTEMTSKATSAGRDAAMVGLGGALLYAALLGLMATIVLGLIQAGITPWLSALIVTIVAAAIGGVLVQQGRSRLANANLAPTRTVESVKDDAEWAKERVR